MMVQTWDTWRNEKQGRESLVHAKTEDSWPINTRRQEEKRVHTPIKLNACKPKPSQRSNYLYFLTFNSITSPSNLGFLYISPPTLLSRSDKVLHISLKPQLYYHGVIKLFISISYPQFYYHGVIKLFYVVTFFPTRLGNY